MRILLVPIRVGGALLTEVGSPVLVKPAGQAFSAIARRGKNLKLIAYSPDFASDDRISHATKTLYDSYVLARAKKSGVLTAATTRLVPMGHYA